MGRQFPGDIHSLHFSNELKKDLRKALLEWFENNGRHDIPWKLKENGSRPNKGEQLSVYKIWVAEVMLQQTQLQVVLPFWNKWMKAFPSIISFANADEQEVLLHWQGLGYYSRARRFHAAAKIITKTNRSSVFTEPVVWPQDLESWLALPGIGRTTANSILSSAFDAPFPLLDGNVKRVLSRLIASPQPTKDCLKDLWVLSENLLDRDNSRNFNQGLMDLGAKVCRPSNPKCSICPWHFSCLAYSFDNPAIFPVKPEKKELPFEVVGIGVVLNQDGYVLIDQRLNNGLLGGMWEFPGGKQEKSEAIQETIVRELQEELGIEVAVEQFLISLNHSYTHKKIRFEVYLCKWIHGEPKPLASQKVLWVKPSALCKYPFPAANAKMIKALLEFLQ